jgi:YggT family protein
MNVIVVPLYRVLSIAIELYIWALVASAVLSWLVAFNVINTRNGFVYTVMNALYRLTEPALRPIRRILPNLGGLDISPIILILILYFIQSMMDQLAISYIR